MTDPECEHKERYYSETEDRYYITCFGCDLRIELDESEFRVYR